MSCTQTLCASSFVAATSVLNLQCGAENEEISEVSFNIAEQPMNCSLLNSSDVASSCTFSIAKATLEALCKSKEGCSPNASAIISAACSSPVGLELSAAISCKDKSTDSCTLVLNIVSILFILLIGLALGTTLDLLQCKKVWEEKKRAVLVGWCSQFGFMPLTAFILAKISGVESLIAVGVVLVGMTPGGTTSNLFTLWTHGDIALSIVMSCASTICAIFMIPLLFIVYVNSGLAKDANIDSNALPGNIALTLVFILVPTGLGMAVRHNNKEAAVKVQKAASAACALSLMVTFTVAISCNAEYLDVGKYAKENFVIGLFFQPVGCLCGYLLATLAQLPPPDKRTVMWETGIQNYALSFAISQISFSGCERSLIQTFIFIAPVWYLINSLWILAVTRSFLGGDGKENSKAAAAIPSASSFENQAMA